MTKKHLLTILFIVLSAIIMVSCSNTQAVVSVKKHNYFTLGRIHIRN